MVEEPSVDCRIDDDDRGGQCELDFPGQPGRVDDGQEIVLDEAFAVARFAGLEAQVVLGGGQWAEAAGEFDKDAPGCGWKVDEG